MMTPMPQTSVFKISRAALVALVVAMLMSCSRAETPPVEIKSVGRGAPVVPAIPWEMWRNADDIEAILDATPKARHTTLFSATMPQRILRIAERHLRDPHRLKVAAEKRRAGTLPRVRQVAYIVRRDQKAQALDRVLDMEQPSSAIVFCRTRLEVDTLVETLNAHGYRAEALHGGMVQRQRDAVMNRFRSARTDLLIATDVAGSRDGTRSKVAPARVTRLAASAISLFDPWTDGDQAPRAGATAAYHPVGQKRTGIQSAFSPPAPAPATRRPRPPNAGAPPPVADARPGAAGTPSAAGDRC